VREVALRRAAGRLSFFVGIGHDEIFLFAHEKRVCGGPPSPGAPVKNLTVARISGSCGQKGVQVQNKSATERALPLGKSLILNNSLYYHLGRLAGGAKLRK
jgi:hypothetical protein